MEGLGRLFNVVPIADTADLFVGDCDAVTYICTGNDTFTVQEHQTNGGSGTNLAVITQKYTNSSTAGAAAWVEATQAAGAAVTISSGAVAFTVHTDQLSDGYDYLSCTASSAGLVTAILHDLNVQRAPANLRILAA